MVAAFSPTFDRPGNPGLQAAERLLREQAERLEELRQGHAALAVIVSEALRQEALAGKISPLAERCAADERCADAAKAVVPPATLDAAAAVAPVAVTAKAPASAAANDDGTSTAGGEVAELAGGRQLDSHALRVLSAAHEQGYVLDDLPGLGAAEWSGLGAAPSDRDTILAALRDWRLRGVAGGNGGRAPEAPPACFRDHLRGAAPVVEDAPGSHGHARDDDFQDGLRRGLGHGRRHLEVVDHLAGAMGGLARSPTPSRLNLSPACHLHGAAMKNLEDAPEFPVPSPGKALIEAAKDHIYGGTLRDDYHEVLTPPRQVAAVGGQDHLWGGAYYEDAPGSHGHLKDIDYQGGLARCIGHGRRHYGGGGAIGRDHIRGGAAGGDEPGTHGHNRDDDFEDGLERGIGHGRRRVGGGDSDRVRRLLAGVVPQRDARVGHASAALRSPSAPSTGRGSSAAAGGTGSPHTAPEQPLGRAAGLPSRYAGLMLA